MKKLMIILTGVLAVASIFLVVFFGVLPFSKDTSVYCDYIVMNMQTIMHNDDVVASVSKRPNDEEIKVGDDWFDNDYNYRIRVSDTNYLFDHLDHQINLYCEARTNRVGKLVSDPKLNYYCNEPEDYTKYIESFDNGIIKFNKDAFPSAGRPVVPFTFKVVSNDAHKQSINIRIQVAAREG